MKLVINAKHGGFSLSGEAWEWLRDRGQKDAINEEDVRRPRDADESDQNYSMRQMLANISLPNGSMLRDIDRSDPLLVECVGALGERADGAHARLKIVEIPDGVEWVIEEYDGREWVAEKHRTWD